MRDHRSLKRIKIGNLLFSLALCAAQAKAFYVGPSFPLHNQPPHLPRRSTDLQSVSQDIVSSLTSIVNSFGAQEGDPLRPIEEPPTSATELQDRIAADYTEWNYLWNGNIDLACFDEECTFTDPTISFQGTDQFVRNLRNLQPIVDNLVREDGCQSDLLSISVDEEQCYVSTRWNMVGDLVGLPWRPRVDVIGKTKFWYKTSEKGEFKICKYDEVWEIPAWRALLQLITPSGLEE